MPSKNENVLKSVTNWWPCLQAYEDCSVENASQGWRVIGCESKKQHLLLSQSAMCAAAAHLGLLSMVKPRIKMMTDC